MRIRRSPMKTYQYPRLGLENLALVECDEPKPAPREVVVKFHAASLNYRDLLFAEGLYNPRPNLPAVPLSDGAGEVTAVGEGVTKWQAGDRVCPAFFQGWIEGPRTAEKTRSALGAGEMDGVLREFGAFHEEGLVRIPAALSDEEAATLPCAAVTAWHALVDIGKIKAGDTVLTLGTGGVSIFAVQFAKLHGARVIATSSSDEKLARARALGADETINYKTTPDWEKKVLELTGGEGVDLTLEVGGIGTLPRTMRATRYGGRVSLIGVLSGIAGDVPIGPILHKMLQINGIYVGSHAMFADLNRVLAQHRIEPVLDRVFDFAEMPAAFQYFQKGLHFGKVCVTFA